MRLMPNIRPFTIARTAGKCEVVLSDRCPLNWIIHSCRGRKNQRSEGGNGLMSLSKLSRAAVLVLAELPSALRLSERSFLICAGARSVIGGGMWFRFVDTSKLSENIWFFIVFLCLMRKKNYFSQIFSPMDSEMFGF